MIRNDVGEVMLEGRDLVSLAMPIDWWLELHDVTVNTPGLEGFSDWIDFGLAEIERREANEHDLTPNT